MERENNHEWKIPWKAMIIALLVSAAALAVIFCQISSPRDILKELSAYPLTYFFSALFFVLAAWIVDGQRIGALARLLGQEIPWWRLAILLGAANFLTLVTPFAGGGGALILYYLYRRGLRSPQAAAVVLGGGLAGQSALALLGFTTSAALRSVPADLAPVFSAVKFGALVYLFILAALQTAIIKSDRFFRWAFQKMGRESRSAAWLDEFRGTYEFLIAKRTKSYIGCVAIAICYYVVYYFGTFLLLSGFGIFYPWLRFAIAVLFGVAPVFSPIPGGAGLSEGISWAVLDGVLGPDQLASFIVLWRTVVFYIPILLGGTIFVLMVMRWAAKSNITSRHG